MTKEKGLKKNDLILVIVTMTVVIVAPVMVQLFLYFDGLQEEGSHSYQVVEHKKIDRSKNTFTLLGIKQLASQEEQLELLSNDIKALESIERETEIGSDLSDELNETDIRFKFQDAFEDQLCTAENIRVNYESELSEWIGRLSEQYKHYQYILSDEVTVNLYAVRMTSYFKSQLLGRLSYLIQYYKYLNIQWPTEKITVNLVITASKEDYKKYLLDRYDGYEWAAGLYLGGLNLAFVDYYPEKEMLSIATHESVHAFNAHLIGRTLKTFSEGMAKYLEKISFRDGYGYIEQPQSILTDNILPINQFFDEQQWASLDIDKLYYSSWAWMSFALGTDSEKGLNVIRTLIEKEQGNECLHLPYEDVINILDDAYDGSFELAFQKWLNQLGNQESLR